MDILALLAQVEEEMLRDGEIFPMLHMQMTTDYLIVALDILDNTQSVPEQCGSLARHGRDIGKQHLGQEPLSICYYANGWVRKTQDDMQIKLRPARDPARREVILVSCWQKDEPHWQSYALPVQRNKKGHLLKVGPVEGPVGAMSEHVEAFLHGVRDSHLSDAEANAVVDQKSKEAMARFSPEQLQKLLQLADQEGYGELVRSLHVRSLQKDQKEDKNL